MAKRHSPTKVGIDSHKHRIAGGKKAANTRKIRQAVRTHKADRVTNQKGRNFHKEQLSELGKAHKLQGVAKTRSEAVKKAWETRFDTYGPHGCHDGKNGKANGEHSKKYRDTKKKIKKLMKSTRKARHRMGK